MSQFPTKQIAQLQKICTNQVCKKTEYDQFVRHTRYDYVIGKFSHSFST